MLEGGCFCGFVRYRVEGSPSHETHCHCTICRRTSGAPFVSWFSVPVAGHAFVRGEPTTLRSSDHGSRSFCPRCGTPLCFQSSRSPEEIDVTICTLDDPGRVPPRDHTHARSKLSWIEPGDGLPVYPRARD